MPTIHTPKQRPEYDDTRRSEVVGFTEAKLFAVAWVNSEGRKSMSLVLVFGKDSAEPEHPGIFIMADEQQMGDTLKMPNSTILKGVRKHLAAADPTTEASVPSSLGTVDLTGDGPMESPIAEGEDADPLSSILPD